MSHRGYPSVGFFFALVTVPFVLVWLFSQGPKTLDQFFPTYELVNVGEADIGDNAIAISNVSFKKHFSCKTEELIYLSGTYKDSFTESEVLFLSDPIDDVDRATMNPTDTGARSFTLGTLRFNVSRAMFKKLSHFRFMIPCVRAMTGETHAYTGYFPLK